MESTFLRLSQDLKAFLKRDQFSHIKKSAIHILSDVQLIKTGKKGRSYEPKALNSIDCVLASWGVCRPTAHLPSLTHSVISRSK